MTDDIVTQLREIRWEWDKTWVDKMKDAAYEIEYLREQVRLLQHSIKHQVCECSHCLGEEGAT